MRTGVRLPFSEATELAKGFRRSVAITAPLSGGHVQVFRRRVLVLKHGVHGSALILTTIIVVYFFYRSLERSVVKFVTTK